MLIVAVLLSLVAACGVVGSLHRYCDVDSRNLPCESKCQRSPHCGETPTGFRTLHKSNTSAIVAMINGHRNAIASGHFKDLPAAANMWSVRYDFELEFLAGCALKRCQRYMQSVLVSKDGHFLSRVGFGIISKRYEPVMGMSVVHDQLNAWFHEVNSSHLRDQLNKLPPMNPLWQLVYAGTKYIGCANLVSYVRYNYYHNAFLCLFKPSAQLNDSLYLPGKPASLCNSSNDDYTALCGSRQQPKPFKPPIDLNAVRVFNPSLALLSLSMLILLLPR